MPTAPQLQFVETPFRAVATSLITQSREIEDVAYVIAKRLLDVIGSLSALLIGSPVFLTIALLVKITSCGPVLFRHQRLGRDGKLFWCYKFRTMVDGAEEQLRSQEVLRKSFEENFKLNQDPRITPLGAFLRRSSLDELPQFWNVFAGDISLIGPRPIVPAELTKYGRHGEKLLSITPGLSGLWQACGRSDTTYEERIQLDMLYIDHRSFWLDVTLIIRTFFIVAKRIGAH